MARNIIWSIMLLMAGSVLTEAQTLQPPPADDKWHDNLVYGGGLGVGFNSGWNINASPFVGYKLTQQLIAGIGVDYIYSSFDFDSGNKERYSVFGPRMFSIYQISDVVNATVEFIPYRLTQTIIRNDVKTKATASQESLLIGGGYLQRFGDRGGIRLELLYDVLYDDDDEFNFRSSALIPRISFVYGL